MHGRRDCLQLYLVMDFMGGGELFTHLQEKKLLREDAVRVYAAEIVLAIEYLHSRDIIHRCVGVRARCCPSTALRCQAHASQGPEARECASGL